MVNRKIRHAGFNLRLQAVIKDNWRFLSGVCVVLANEYGWSSRRLNAWVEAAAGVCELFNGYDIDDIYRYKLDELERRHGDIITRRRVEDIVIKNTTLKDPGEVSEIIDNLLLQLLMTVNEFDGVGRKRLIEGLEKTDRAGFDAAPEFIKRKYGVELDTSFQDYHSILKERAGKVKKESLTDRKRAKQALEAFRAWSEVNNPG